MYAIEVEKVSRIYQKYSARHRFQTFKSALVRGDLFKALKPDELVAALDDVTLFVEKGQTFGVIGENGSGKSTLLKLVAGIAKPTRGRVRTEGKVSALIELGAGFHPEISGRENIFINGIMLGLTKKEITAKFDEIVKFAELEDFIDAPVKTYSSGMYMRLGFAIAINVNPDILLIDEVLAVGDASFVPKCLDRIDDFRRRKKTILFVSHDLTTVEKICDRVAWFKDGRVRDIGEAKRVIDACLKNRAGQEKHVFSPDEGMAIEIEINSPSRIDDFVFGIGIFNSQGISCYGTNTQLEDFEPVAVEGRGKVICRIPELNLSNGTYYLDVAVHKMDGYPYDYHRNLYSFLVSSTSKEVGIARLPHDWSFSDGIQIKPQPGTKA
jgi:ABC-type polysaccharide/polyol phosphate transport system ATPase subunit